MMFDTPMPPTTRVSTPMMPRKILKPSMKVSKKANISVVSQTWTAWSSAGSNRLRGAESGRDLSGQGLVEVGLARLVDEEVDVLLPGEGPEGGRRDDHLAVVAPGVGRVLVLFLSTPITVKGEPWSMTSWPTGSRSPKRSAGDLVADEDHPAALLHVDGVDEPPPSLRESCCASRRRPATRRRRRPLGAVADART